MEDRAIADMKSTSSHCEISRLLTCTPRIEKDHLVIETKQTIPKKIGLLLDTGSKLNLIKLLILNLQVLVDETNCYRLTRINEQITQTLTKVELSLQVDNSNIETEFHVVQSNFNIPHEGILGKPFLKKNKIIIDFKSNQVVLWPCIVQNLVCQTLQEILNKILL